MKAQQMIDAHPQKWNKVDSAAVTELIESALECAQTCTTCADACLAEEMVSDLRHCIRTDLDCADVCATTARLLSRQTSPAWDLLRAQVGACYRACGECADECEKHADMHEHCRICAEACRRCEQACDRMLHALEEAALASREPVATA